MCVCVRVRSCGGRDNRQRNGGFLRSRAGEPGEPGRLEGCGGRKRHGDHDWAGVRQGQNPDGSESLINHDDITGLLESRFCCPSLRQVTQTSLKSVFRFPSCLKCVFVNTLLRNNSYYLGAVCFRHTHVKRGNQESRKFCLDSGQDSTIRLFYFLFFCKIVRKMTIVKTFIGHFLVHILDF